MNSLPYENGSTPGNQLDASPISSGNTHADDAIYIPLSDSDSSADWSLGISYRSVFFARYPRYYEGYTSSQRYNLLGYPDGCDDYPVIYDFNDVWNEDDFPSISTSPINNSLLCNTNSDVDSTGGSSQEAASEDTVEMSPMLPDNQAVSTTTSAECIQTSDFATTTSSSATREEDWSDSTSSSDSPPKRKKPSSSRRRGGRKTWTKDEDVQLCKAVMKYNQRHWKCIARELGTQRSETECRQHYCRVLMRSTNTGRWSDDEVDRLRRAVDDGLTWSEVATCVGTRDKTQCKSKWIQLVEKCSGHTWTEDEENVLLDLYNEYPGNWELISGMMNTDLTTEEIRRHYRYLISRNGN